MVVHSGKNTGTKFKVYLPATETKPEETAVRKESVIPAGNGERVLVVDDEQGVLALVRNALENFNYRVTTAESGPEAIALFTEAPAAFALVITDFAMPLMNGRATIEALRKIRPDIKIILASGSEKEINEARHHVKAGGYIAKPFTTEALLKTVHAALSPKA
jgi:CheY-like chemotaxis protein